jgi:hypothetical protein
VLSSMEEVGIRVYRTPNLKMALLEMLYGFRCQTSLFWNEIEKREVLDATYCKKRRNKFIWWERT